MENPEAPRDSSWWADAWANAAWINAAKNSDDYRLLLHHPGNLFSARMAALGLSRPEMPFRRVIMAVLISPMIVPIIITATGLFFFYSAISIQAWGNTYLGIIMAHATLGIPFVIITVTATLVGFDQTLTQRGSLAWAQTRPLTFLQDARCR